MKDLTSKPAGTLAEKPDGTGKLAEFMERIKTHRATHQGRLAFVVDATASREGTWDLASKLQAEMFEAAAALGTLALLSANTRPGSATAARWPS
jgi:hypothetical protein